MNSVRNTALITNMQNYKFNSISLEMLIQPLEFITKTSVSIINITEILNTTVFTSNQEFKFYQIRLELP